MNWDIARILFSLLALLFACFAYWNARRALRDLSDLQREIDEAIERLP